MPLLNSRCFSSVFRTASPRAVSSSSLLMLSVPGMNEKKETVVCCVIRSSSPFFNVNVCVPLMLLQYLLNYIFSLSNKIKIKKKNTEQLFFFITLHDMFKVKCHSVPQTKVSVSLAVLDFSPVGMLYIHLIDVAKQSCGRNI